MFSEGRATRSRRFLGDPIPMESIPRHNTHMTDTSTMLTPPMSQPDDCRRTLRRGRSSVRQHPYFDVPHASKSKHGPGSITGFSIAATAGSTCPSIASLDPDDINLDALEMWTEIGGIDGLSSENDPLMYNAGVDVVDSTSGNGTRELHTPPGSPNMLSSSVPTPMMHRPETPTIRPGTPGDMGNPLTPAMDTGLVTSSLDTDTGFVETSSSIGYGPPPTPMCPPSRVGNLSSSSLCVHLPLSSTATASASAAPPMNILDSEEDDDDDNDNYEIYSYFGGAEDDNNTGTYNPTYINNITTTSPDIISESTAKNLAEPSNIICSSPPSPESTLSKKHSHRLRIKALHPRSRSCHRSRSLSKLRKAHGSKGESHKGGSKKASQRKSSESEIVTKSILKPYSTSGSTSKLKLNFIKRVKKVSYSNDVKDGNKNKGSSGGSSGGGSTTTPLYKTINFKIPNIMKDRSPVVTTSTQKSIAYQPHTPETENQEGKEEEVGAAVASTSSPSEAVISTTSESDPSPLLLNHPNINANNQTERMRDGCLKTLFLKNFMAHKNLFCEWKGHVVFVNGENGSGKSAILNGIQMLFGHKAANTNRTNTVVDFIKKGCKSALIQARIYNHNTLSREKYGEEIVLSRQISTYGSSVYKVSIPNTDKERQITSSELMKIRNALQIDPNNPIQFYQQERSKENAKRGSSASLKRDFQIVKDATHLTQYENLLKEAEENFRATVAEIKDKSDHLEHLVGETKRLAKEMQQIEKFEKSAKELKNLEIEKLWSEVRDSEEAQKEIKIRTEEEFKKIEDYNNDLKKITDKKEDYAGVTEKLKSQVESIRVKVKQYTRDEDSKLSELRDVDKTLVRVSNDRKRIEQAIKGYKQKKSELEALQEEDTHSFEEQNQKYQTEIDRWENLIPEKERQLEKQREERDGVHAEITKFKEREKAALGKIKQLEHELGTLNKELNKKDKYYGRGMKELEHRIPREKWDIMPVGPLGGDLIVKDGKYAPIIEYILGPSTLCAFVVQTAPDFVTMMNLIRDVWPENSNNGRKATIIRIAPDNITKYMRNVKHLEEKLKGLTTVLSQLTIKNPMVKVGLIEKKNCEKVVIFDSFTDAAARAKVEGGMPKEVSAVFTPGIKNRQEWYRLNVAPHYAAHPIFGVKRATELIPMTTEDAKISIKQEIAREKEVSETCRQSLKGYKEGLVFRQGLEQLLKTNDAKIKEINEEIYKYRNKMNYFRSMIKAPTVQKQDNNLQKQLQEEDDRILEQENKLQLRLEEVECANQAKAKLEIEIEELKQKSAEAHNRLKQINKEYSDAVDGVTRIEKEEAELENILKPLKVTLHNLSREGTKAEEEVNQKIKIAQAAGARPEELERSPSEVQQEKDELTAFLKKNKDLIQSKQTVLPELNNKLALVKDFTAELKDFHLLEDEYRPYLKVADIFLENERGTIANMLEVNFQNLVEYHGLTGKLLVRWDTETLVYYVSPDEASDERARNNFSTLEGRRCTNQQGILNYIRSLSGGEFSKSRAYFLISVWEIIESPFFFVDEFETNMDLPSILKVQGVFIKHARKHPDKQFFFFTPQVLIGIPKNDPAFNVMHLKKIMLPKGQKAISSSDRRAIEAPPTPSSSKKHHHHHRRRNRHDDDDEENRHHHRRLAIEGPPPTPSPSKKHRKRKHHLEDEYD